jgi:hypothetical protein
MGKWSDFEKEIKAALYATDLDSFCATWIGNNIGALKASHYLQLLNDRITKPLFDKTMDVTFQADTRRFIVSKQDFIIGEVKSALNNIIELIDIINSQSSVKPTKIFGNKFITLYNNARFLLGILYNKLDIGISQKEYNYYSGVIINNTQKQTLVKPKR